MKLFFGKDVQTLQHHPTLERFISNDSSLKKVLDFKWKNEKVQILPHATMYDHVFAGNFAHFEMIEHQFSRVYETYKF